MVGIENLVAGIGAMRGITTKLTNWEARGNDALGILVLTVIFTLSIAYNDLDVWYSETPKHAPGYWIKIAAISGAVFSVLFALGLAAGTATRKAMEK
jgi:hypothetical protein